jgi:hypothetical protein
MLKVKQQSKQRLKVPSKPREKGKSGGYRKTEFKINVKRAHKDVLKRIKVHFLSLLRTQHPDLVNHSFDEFKDEKTFKYACEIKLKLASKLRLQGVGSMVVDSNDNTIYPFRIASEHNFSSTAGGIINQVLDNDPSTCTEYTSLTALFSLVRIRRAVYRVVRSVSTAVPTTTSVGAFRPLMVVPLIDNAGAPGSFAAIEDSPNVIMYNYAFDTSMHGFKCGSHFGGDEEPLWADTSVPASSTTFVGCPGGLQIYGESMPIGTECLFILRELFLEFTNRI